MNIHDKDDGVLIDSVVRTNAIIDEIYTNKTLVKEGLGFLAETEDRLSAFLHRQKELGQEKPRQDIPPAPTIVEEFERKIGPVNNMLSIEFLEVGLLAARSVGRLKNRVYDGYGTGFHVGNGIVITNNHVIQSAEDAGEWQFELNVEDNQIGTPKNQLSYILDPERFFLTNKEYDFTLVAVGARKDYPTIESFGWHVLLDVKGKILIGQPINIIQHPKGENKVVVVHDSHLLYLDDKNLDTEKYCLYSSDTEEGSSGSPVFNNRWEVIALHHKAIPKTDANGNYIDENDNLITNEKDKVYLANEGIRVSRLIQAIKNSHFDTPEKALIRDNLINLWNEAGSHPQGLLGK